MELKVYYQDKLVGTLKKDLSQWSFAYDNLWLHDKEAFAISLNFPLTNELFDHSKTHAFFSNLLPESEIRSQIARSIGISQKNDFSLLREIGGECAGALSILKENQPVSIRGDYKLLTNKQLLTFIISSPTTPLIHALGQLRLSLAGAQHKLPLFKKDGKYFLPLGCSASTYILKPQNEHFKALAENEYFCMQLAKAVGLSVADTELLYLQDVAVLEVKRYDRIDQHGKVVRLHQEDFCQALSVPSDSKYEVEGEVTLKKCFDIIVKYSSQPIIDKLSLLRWIMFNYIIGNADAHAKNISLIYKDRKVMLAPFYDLVATVIYNGLTENMAMKIGGEKRLGKLRESHLKNLAKLTDIKENFVLSEFQTINLTIKKQSILLSKKLKEHVKNTDVINKICCYINDQKLKKKDKL